MYTNFTISRDEELTEHRLNQILNQFQSSDLLIAQKLKRYYEGKQDIFTREVPDPSRPWLPTCCNFTHLITDEFVGVLAGIEPSITGDGTEKINEIFDYNDFHEQMIEFLRQACIYGRSFICNFVADGKQRLQVLPNSGETCIPVFSDTVEHELLYVVRMWEDTSNGNLDTQIKYKVEVYGPEDIKYYDSTPGFETFVMTNIVNHFYGQCPITMLQTNEYSESVYGQILTLQDAYNSIITDGIDNIRDFSDAFLIIYGNIASSDDLTEMKKNRCILLGGEDEKVEYLTKNVSDTNMMDMLDTIEKKIYSVACCADFGDEVFGNASSGLSLQFKLLAFEQRCSGIEAQMRKSIQRIIELCATLLNLTESAEEKLWVNAEITFTRNIPVDLSSIVQTVTQLRGLLSTESLIALLPFVSDPQLELEKLREEEKNALDLYPDWEHEHIIAEEDEDENEDNK